MTSGTWPNLRALPSSQESWGAMMDARLVNTCRAGWGRGWPMSDTEGKWFGARHENLHANLPLFPLSC